MREVCVAFHRILAQKGKSRENEGGREKWKRR